jgi:hypothetical protein
MSLIIHFYLYLNAIINIFNNIRNNVRMKKARIGRNYSRLKNDFL